MNRHQTNSEIVQKNNNEDQKPFQHYYPENLSHCFGCGYMNEYGLQIKSYWDGDESVCLFHPKPYHIAIPGYVYGGILASIIDCHGTATAAAAAYRTQERAMDSNPPLRFMTASLHIDFRRPTPLGVPLEVRASIKEIKGRKIIVSARVIAEGQVCVHGEVIAVEMPERLRPE